jgi:hypothetical protein
MIFHGKSGFAKAPHCTLLVLSTCVSGQGWYESYQQTVSAVMVVEGACAVVHILVTAVTEIFPYMLQHRLLAEHNCSFA